jgi:FeS assembly SUF system protein
MLLFWAKVEKKRQLAVLIFYFVVSLLAIFKYDRMDFDKFAIEERIIEMLKTVFDPEIPVNVYDLGLIYKIDVQENGMVLIDMTLTAPNCPAADFIMEDVRQKVESVEGVNTANVNLVFEPEWDKDMMSEEAKLELGFL